LGVLILIPLFLSLILLIGAATLNGEEHPALKIFFFLLSFVPFFVAINWGIIVLSKYFIIDELIDSMGETTYWVMIVFVVIIFYFIAYWIYKIIGMMAQKKEERIEY
jgi:amino acid permease